MGVVGKTLEENYLYFVREVARIDGELLTLPRGSVSAKKIGGREYFYRQWREGNRVRTEALGREAPAAVVEALRRRKLLETQRREALENIATIARAVDTQRVTVYEVVRLLSENGVAALMAGSYCIPVLREHLGLDLPSIRTEDVDFVVPTPYRGRPVDIEALLSPLGFSTGFNADGSVYFSNGSFKVEFVTPEKGRGADKSVPINALKIRVQPLRYAGMLSDDALKLASEGREFAVPNPWVLAFNKILVAPRRRRESQREKDMLQARALLREVKKKPEYMKKALAYLETLPRAWRKSIRGFLKDLAPDWEA